MSDMTTTRVRTRPFGPRYAFVALGTVFVCLLVSAGVRGAVGVLMVPWQDAFGWSRATIALAAAIGIFLYGLVGPFAAALIQRFGVRRVMLIGPSPWFRPRPHPACL